MYQLTNKERLILAPFSWLVCAAVEVKEQVRLWLGFLTHQEKQEFIDKAVAKMISDPNSKVSKSLQKTIFAPKKRL